MRPSATRVLWLTLLFVTACRHELDLPAHDDLGANDAGVSDGSTKATASDAASEDARGLDGSTGGDAATPVDPFPYRWRENAPPAGDDEGYITIALQCERDGEPVDCPMRCAYDGSSPRTCGAMQRVFFDAGPHEYCVTVIAPDSDAEFRGQERTQCVPFELVPAKAPFLWVPVTPPSTSTAFELPLQCAQEPAPGGTPEPRGDCDFQCSIDHGPYGPCHRTHELKNLAPGTHELRVKTCGPKDHKYEKVCRARLLTFPIAEDAQPPVPPVPEVVLPPLLAREAFAELAALVDVYPAYAESCLGYAYDNSGYDAEDAIVAYLSAAFRDGNGLLSFNADDLARCVSELEAAPASCLVLPGVSDGDLRDLMLPVRLPDECRWLLSGIYFTKDPGFYGDSCLVHTDCLEGLCEHQDTWVDVHESNGEVERTYKRPDSYGLCGNYLDNLEGVDEGIYCSSTGCKEGLYCDSYCRPVKKPGEACSRYLGGIDCSAGYTCSQTDPRVCVLATLKNGEQCARSRDCMSGYCERGTHVCAPRLARDAPCNDPRACLSGKCDWFTKTCY